MARRRPCPRRLLRPGLTVTGPPSAPLDLLPRPGSALAVYAHPDDDTFGLGAVLGALVDAGTAVGGLCFTRGEASTLGGRPDDLGAVRAAELAGVPPFAASLPFATCPSARSPGDL